MVYSLVVAEQLPSCVCPEAEYGEYTWTDVDICAGVIEGLVLSIAGIYVKVTGTPRSTRTSSGSSGLYHNLNHMRPPAAACSQPHLSAFALARRGISCSRIFHPSSLSHCYRFPRHRTTLPSAEMSPALNALRLLITIAAARAFYMPPAFDAEAVPGYNVSESSAAQNSSSSEASGAPGTSTAVFDFRNRTAWYADSVQPAEAHSTGSPALEEPRTADTADGGSEGTTSVGPRDVWTPRITAPDAGTVWNVGETVTVRW